MLERRLGQQLAAALPDAGAVLGVERCDIRADRARPRRGTAPTTRRTTRSATRTVSDVDRTSREPGRRRRSRRARPRRVPARSASPGAAGSMLAGGPPEHRQRRRPPAKSQTLADTTPPGLVTRPISRSPATGSVMKCTTSCASAASKVSSSNGRASAVASCTSTPGKPLADGRDERRRRVDRRRRGPAPQRSTRGAVRTPGPHPTSSDPVTRRTATQVDELLGERPRSNGP